MRDFGFVSNCRVGVAEEPLAGFHRQEPVAQPAATSDGFSYRGRRVMRQPRRRPFRSVGVQRHGRAENRVVDEHDQHAQLPRGRLSVFGGFEEAYVHDQIRETALPRQVSGDAARKRDPEGTHRCCVPSFYWWPFSGTTPASTRWFTTAADKDKARRTFWLCGTGPSSPWISWFHLLRR